MEPRQDRCRQVYVRDGARSGRPRWCLLNRNVRHVLGQHRKCAARWAFFAAGVCCVLTLTDIIGFQSESREGLAQSRERAVRIVDSFVNFARETTVEAVQKDKSKGAVALATGIETVGKADRDQIGVLQTGEVVPLADGQATTMSRI